MNIRTKQIVSVILAIASSIGVGATAYLAVKHHTKAETKKQELLEKKPDATKFDILKAELPAYVPAIAVGGATVASIVASHILNKRAEVSLIAGATMLDQGWRRYSDKVKKVLGIESHNKVVSALAEDRAKTVPVKDSNDGRELYYVEPIGFFRAKPEDLAWAYGDMNQRLHTVDTNGQTAYFCLLYDMIRDAKAEILDKNISNDHINWGWTSSYLKDLDKPMWIHMNLTEKTLEDGTKYTLISFDEDPIFDPSSGGSMYVETVESDENVSSNYKKVNRTENVKHGEHNESD